MNIDLSKAVSGTILEFKEGTEGTVKRIKREGENYLITFAHDHVGLFTRAGKYVRSDSNGQYDVVAVI